MLDTGQPFPPAELWALSFGNDGSAGSTDTLFFTAGLSNNTDGLFGAISSVPEPSSAVLGLIALGVLAGGWRWKNRRRRREVLIDRTHGRSPVAVGLRFSLPPGLPIEDRGNDRCVGLVLHHDPELGSDIALSAGRILWEFVACQLPRSPSCLSPGTAASLFRRWSIGPNWKFERKAKGLRKGTEKKISQPRMKHGWNTAKKVGQLPQPITLVIFCASLCLCM